MDRCAVLSGQRTSTQVFGCNGCYRFGLHAVDYRGGFTQSMRGYVEKIRCQKLLLSIISTLGAVHRDLPSVIKELNYFAKSINIFDTKKLVFLEQ